MHNGQGQRPANVTLAEAWGTGMVHMLTGVGWGGWSSGHDNNDNTENNEKIEKSEKNVNSDDTHSNHDKSDSNVINLFDRRDFVAHHYDSSFHQARVEGAGGVANGGRVATVAVQTRQFKGLTDAEKEFAAKTANIPWPPPEGASLWDTHPPATFLAALEPEPTDQSAFTFCNSAREFWGNGGMAKPGRGTRGVCGWHASVTEGETALIASTTLSVAPGTSVKVRNSACE